jgi:hypothetical protein
MSTLHANSAVILTLLFCASCANTHHCTSDLSMQFTHPELYAGRTSDDVRIVREMALDGMRRARLLKRGMSDDAIQRLLGVPPEVVRFDGSTKFTYEGFDHLLSSEDSAEPPREQWWYRQRVSYLIVEIDRTTRKVQRYERVFDRPEGIVFHKDEVW